MLISKPLAAALFGGFLLTGCSAAGTAIGYAEGKVDEAIDLKQRQSNVEAKAVVKAPCVMTVGAYMRVLQEREQEAVRLLCSPADLSEQERARIQVVD